MIWIFLPYEATRRFSWLLLPYLSTSKQVNYRTPAIPWIHSSSHSVRGIKKKKNAIG